MPDHSDIGEEERAQIALLGGQIPHTCKSHIFSCVEQYDAYAPHTNTNRKRISLSVSFNYIHTSTHICIHTWIHYRALPRCIHNISLSYYQIQNIIIQDSNVTVYFGEYLFLWQEDQLAFFHDGSSQLQISVKLGCFIGSAQHDGGNKTVQQQ